MFSVFVWFSFRRNDTRDKSNSFGIASDKRLLPTFLPLVNRDLFPFFLSPYYIDDSVRRLCLSC